MTIPLEEPTDLAGAHEAIAKKKRRLPKVLNRHTVIPFVTFIALSIIVFLCISPLVIRALFPEYNIAKNYSVIAVCTDEATAHSAVFLPVSCASITHSSSIGCIYSSTSHYVAPAMSTEEQRVLCPTLITKQDTRGIKNPALATLPIEESILKLEISAVVMVGATVLYIAAWLIYRARHT